MTRSSSSEHIGASTASSQRRTEAGELELLVVNRSIAES